MPDPSIPPRFRPILTKYQKHITSNAMPCGDMYSTPRPVSRLIGEFPAHIIQPIFWKSISGTKAESHTCGTGSFARWKRGHRQTGRPYVVVLLLGPASSPLPWTAPAGSATIHSGCRGCWNGNKKGGHKAASSAHGSGIRTGSSPPDSGRLFLQRPHHSNSYIQDWPTICH